MRRCLVVLACVFAGCSQVEPDKFELAFMVMVSNTTTGQWAIATSDTLNTASFNAHTQCPSCGDAGSCAWTSVDSTSSTWGALARSDNVLFLGQRQYLFGYGCGRSQAEASSKAVASCVEPDISCAVVNASPLVQ